VVLNRFPLWKNLLVAGIVLLGLVFALPNVFGDAPAVQISNDAGRPLDEAALSRVTGILDAAPIAYRTAYLDEGRVTVRFPEVEAQLEAVDRLREQLGRGFVVALTLAPRTPAFLRAVGLEPMSLGLDLRGGV
jgi:preprotein translocase subunit SecD